MYAEDYDGNRSSVLTFPINLTGGVTTKMSGIYIAPTIDVDKHQVKHGENITLFGQTAVEARVTIQVNSASPILLTSTTDKDGVYLYSFDSSLLELGEHTAKSKYIYADEVSEFGKWVTFKVGDTTIQKQPKTHIKAPADVSADGKVNLVDFSIAAYWYKKPDFPQKIDLNKDNKIDLVDLSIMIYYWTG